MSAVDTSGDIAPRAILGAQDASLLQDLVAGDEAAFAALVDRYHAKLVRLAMGFVKSRDVAEEVAQETWLGVVDGIERFEGRSSLKTWLFRILTNRAISRGSREGRTVPFSALGESEGEDAVPAERFTAGFWSDPPREWTAPEAERSLLDREAMTIVQAELERLPPNQRAVVVLRDVEGCESDEVCNVLSISESNQRVLLHRGRARLRAALERKLGSKGPGSR